MATAGASAEFAIGSVGDNGSLQVAPAVSIQDLPEVAGESPQVPVERDNSGFGRQWADGPREEALSRDVSAMSSRHVVEQEEVPPSGANVGAEADAEAAGRGLPGAAPVALSRRSSARLSSRVLSAWRLPLRPGQMPLYVQRGFRAKTYSLLSLQLAVVTGTTFGVHYLALQNFPTLYESSWGLLLFYMLGFLSVFMLMVLRLIADLYPLNYIGLAGTSLLVGVCWGLAPPSLFGAQVHTQVLFILLLTMMGNVMLAPLVVHEKVEAWTSILVSNLLSWATAAAIDVTLVLHFDAQLPWSLVAIFISLGLIVLALILGTGTLMASCDPDRFIHVVITMDCCLLVVTAPVFVFASFIFCTYPAPEERPPDAGAAEEP